MKIVLESLMTVELALLKLKSVKLKVIASLLKYAAIWSKRNSFVISLKVIIKC